MAARLLLTMLALLTSLAAQLTPAQARVRVDGASEIGFSIGATMERRVAPAHAAPVARALSRRHRDGAILMPPPLGLRAASVEIGIDRARE